MLKEIIAIATGFALFGSIVVYDHFGARRGHTEQVTALLD